MQPASAPPQPARTAPHPPGGYVFVVTYGRSGSTLLQNLLNGIDGYCIRGENGNALFHLMRCWHTVRTTEPMRGRRNTGRETGPDDPWFGAERIDPDRLADALVDVFVRDILQPPPGTRVSGFKEIRYDLVPDMFEPLLNFMVRMFPGARFVFNTRDHDRVSRSGWWATMKPEVVKTRLRKAEGLFKSYVNKNPGHCITLHYDDYVADHSRFEALFSFLGEPFDPVLVDRVMDRKLDHMQPPKTS